MPSDKKRKNATVSERILPGSLFDGPVWRQREMNPKEPGGNENRSTRQWAQSKQMQLYGGKIVRPDRSRLQESMKKIKKK